MLPEIEEQHFINWRSKIFNDDRHASHYLFCYTSKPKQKFKQKSFKQKKL